jgi:predicted metal-binding membrane protein
VTKDFGMTLAHTSQRNFFGIAALLFAASATLTISLCDSMSTMNGMPMPGGWNLSMMWMRMPGQTWPGVAMQFIGMWLVMTMAMMLPSLVPMLWRYRQAVGEIAGDYLGALTALVSAGYFFVWALFGVSVFLTGAMLSEVAMNSSPLARVVPMAIGIVVVIAGALQFTRWKARHLECCRVAPVCRDAISLDAHAAWRHGLRLGMHCVHCCCGLTVGLLAIGVMNLYAMALVTAAISVERFAPRGQRTAQCVGAIVVLAGLWMIVNTTVL